ncbi:MAG: cupin domain-containing protein [bacterium]
MRVLPIMLAAALLLAAGCRREGAPEMTRAPLAAGPGDNATARDILERYAGAWRGAEEMKLEEAAVLAFWIEGEGGGEYHITLEPGGPGRLGDGIPSDYAFGFETDLQTLRRLDRGEWNALTAMGQARGSDPIPLVPRTPEGFEWTRENRAFVLPLVFHFWNREWPERVLFGEGVTREVHGGNVVIFYYSEGLRSGWYQVKPGMHMNADPADQTNPFDTLVILTRGTVTARLGGAERVLSEGEAVFVPAGMRHEFWAEEHQYGEFVIVMYGEGA